MARKRMFDVGIPNDNQMATMKIKWGGGLTSKDKNKYKQNTNNKMLLDYIDKLERQIQIKDNYLDTIIGLGADYDGFNKAESLKELIDDLVDRANKAYHNEDKTVEFINYRDGCVNILNEKVEGGPEYDIFLNKKGGKNEKK